MTSLRFALTYDYLCPFARNANEYVVTGLRSGAPWDVTFIPFSLTQAKAAESGEISSDGETTLADGPRTRRGKRSLGDRIKDAIS